MDNDSLFLYHNSCGEISILLLQLYKYVKRCCARHQQSSSIAMPHKLNYGSLDDEDYLLSTFDESD